MNKKVLIGLGVLAVAGIGLYIYNKNKKSSEKKSMAQGANADDEYSEFKLPKWLTGLFNKDDTGFKECSCAYDKPDGSRGVVTQICSKSVDCIYCCEAGGNAARMSMGRIR